MNDYKVLITASGTGSRLGELTEEKNKALIEVGNKPALGRIIEQYSADLPIVITVKYLAEQVKEYVKTHYSQRQVTFIEGSPVSLGASLLNASKELQTPFIFHCCDTLVPEQVITVEENWVMGFPKKRLDFSEPRQYSSFAVNDRKIVEFIGKNEKPLEYLHIGLIGIHDYEIFWHLLKQIYSENPMNSALSDVPVIQRMLRDGSEFSLVETDTWFDTGNLHSLEFARTHFIEQ